MAYLSGDGENEKFRNFDKCGWKLDIKEEKDIKEKEV